MCISSSPASSSGDVFGAFAELWNYVYYTAAVSVIKRRGVAVPNLCGETARWGRNKELVSPICLYSASCLRGTLFGGAFSNQFFGWVAVVWIPLLIQCLTQGDTESPTVCPFSDLSTWMNCRVKQLGITFRWLFKRNISSRGCSSSYCGCCCQ